MLTLQDVDIEVYERVNSLPYRVHAERPTLFSVLGNIEGEHVLDIGCRLGWYTRQFRERGAARVVGVDPSDRLIEAARTASRGTGVEYIVAQPGELGATGVVDIVTAAHVLHFASNAEDLTAECRAAAQALRPGGRFAAVCSSPFFTRGAYETARYGIEFGQQGEALRDGDPISAEILGDDRTQRIQAHYWSVRAYTTALRSAGFKDIAWHLPEVSEAGLRESGAQYWEDFLREPFFAVLECRKPTHGKEARG